MKLVDDIDNDVAENQADEEKSKLFYAMLNGKTVSETITTSMGEFTVRFPKQADLISISRIAALMRNGLPTAHFDNSSEYEIQKCATLDVVVTGGPAWFENAKKKNADFSWGDMPDAGFADEVYAKVIAFRQKVQARLRGVKESADREDSEKVAVGVPPDVGDGVFSGVAGSTE